MMMNNMFGERTGFRLARLEIYNWGTFDGQIWVMRPNTETAVLTGANGSGKSTIVDALLTLLVENTKRNYNVASGSGSRRERNERTYILGQYSRSRGDNTLDATANTLRDYQSHSVLLAVFHDVAQDSTVSLAQIFYMQGSSAKKQYVTATCDLSIEEHFPQRHINKKKLPAKATVHSTFSDYMRSLRKILGLSGQEKALDLFNQTVAVKDIASLNNFVRDHMLESGNAQEKIDRLKNQYRDLNEAHAAIQRAGKQLSILAPLVKEGQSYRETVQRIADYEMAKILVPYYVAYQSRALLETELATLSQQKETQQSLQQTVDARLRDLGDQLERVKISIAQDSVGQEKREIEGQMPPLRREIHVLQGTAKNYDETAQRLGLQPYHDEQSFGDNRTEATRRLEYIDGELEQIEQERSEHEQLQRDKIQHGKEVQEEVEYLRQNPSNIPNNVARIRQAISDALDIPIEQLPFVGELLKVREGEEAWEGALERVLHSFALDLIVPDEHYARVAAYVNQTHLGGRLVYQRVNPNARPNVTLPEHPDDVVLAYDKIAIQQNTPYYDWLTYRLMRKYDYVCCETMTDFQQAKRAITAQGQVKHNANQHEKDDRRNIQDRRHYVLGWDNRDKLRQLEMELDDISRERSRIDTALQNIKRQLGRLRDDKNDFKALLKVTTFAQIDWRSRQAEYDNLQQRLDELNQQSHELAQLERRRDELQHELNTANRQRDAITGQLAKIDTKIQQSDRQLKQQQHLLDTADEAIRQSWDAYVGILEDIDKQPLTVEQISTRANELEVYIQRGVATIKGQQNRHEAIILDAMNTFRREYPEDSASLTADIEALPAFEAIHSRLENDDLPQYDERFKQMLDRTVTQGIQIFSSSLTEQELNIDRSVEQLNQSLRQVDYGGGTHIRLIAEDSHNAEITEFRRELKACIPNVGDNSQEELERAYNRIKALIETYFDNDPNKGKRVTDVRRWRNFAAEQIDLNGKQIEYYSDSSGKSGGQKAKLAYTILASAIAYQYGLQDTGRGNKSFRFVVIDEAFSKLDDDNARFAMQLFDQLQLQLLVVTPMQQLHVIEDYVKSYHMVVNNSEGSYSVVYNLSQKEYRAQRREFEAQG